MGSRPRSRTGLTKFQWRVTKDVGKAIHHYSMLKQGDRILVGLSGGKDSTSLLKILHDRLEWLPIEYTLVAMHIVGIGPCMEKVDVDGLGSYCESIGVDFLIRKPDIDEPAPGKSRCWWCSWNRRKALFKACSELGCNKLALAHHMDDIVETLLLNMFWHGEISTMPPKVEMFKGRMTLIRPLALVTESRMVRYAKESAFPVKLHTCAFGAMNERGFVKKLVSDAARENPKMKKNLFRAMERLKDNVKVDYLV
ncbi:MAG: tRNA 2-thiocytidine(32) synthetase TtcA [Deltaproteobacteria bacterium]|nr:tRNA 2-thiocytidine(32) synthetase TtcA [Deltaproteobacteria bacterium]